MKVFLRSQALIILVACLPLSLAAQDFYWNNASAKSQAQGGVYTPSATGALDALATNPAGLSAISAPTLNAAITSIFSRGSFSNASNQNSPLKNAPGVVPYGAFAMPVGQSGFSFGLGFLPELLSVSDWKYNDTPGVAGANYGLQHNKSAITAVRAAGGVAYRVNSKLSVGATVGVVYNSNTLETPYVFQFHPALAGLKTLLDLHTNGTGVNYSFGALVAPTSKVRFGFGWKSHTIIDSTGTATGNIGIQLAAAGLAARPDFAYNAGVRNVLPQSLVAHVSWQVRPAWQLAFQTNWVNWKDAFKTLPVALTNGNNADINGLLGTSSLPDGVPLDWKNQFAFRGGFERTLRESTTIRGGFAHANSPVPGSTLSPLTAAIMSNQLTAGFGHKVGKAQLDLAYGYGLRATAQSGQTRLLSGEYNNSSVSIGTQMLTLGVTYQF